MYLSKLTLNSVPVCKQVLRDLASPYELHRSIMRAFARDPDGQAGRVLFRLEAPSRNQPPVVLVQSERKPDWSKLDALPGYLSSAESKEIKLSFESGRRLRFRLRANPTVKQNGARHGLHKHEDQCDWLVRKGQQGGFRLVDFAVRRAVKTVSPSVGNANHHKAQTHLSVDFEGILEVTDAKEFLKTIQSGVGPAKGYGCGLLSVAPG